MDNGNEIRDFLVSRRARITPQQAGLPAYGGNRRVKGLRREEVALLAGVSTDYYTRLEQGRLASASAEVLGALASALHLNEDERSYIYKLANKADHHDHQRPDCRNRPRRATGQRLRQRNLAGAARDHQRGRQQRKPKPTIPTMTIGDRLNATAMSASTTPAATSARTSPSCPIPPGASVPTARKSSRSPRR